MKMGVKAGILVGVLAVQLVAAWFLVNWLLDREPGPTTEQVAAEDSQGEGGDAHGKEKGKDKSEKGGDKEKDYEFGAVFSIPDLIINPKGSAGRRIFKISLSLEYDPANVEMAKELEERTPFMRDFLISYLGSMNEDSLSDISYRETIRDSLKLSLDRFISAGEVDRVLFQDFIRQ